MSVNVTFNGVVYAIPNTNGESGWGASLSSYLQALASGAATTSTVKQAVRTATATPVTVVAATDYTVVTNLTVPGAVAVNLPAGVAKQVFVIVDGKGDAATNNVTIDGNGAEAINGSLTYVINENYGGVMLQFDGTGWKILAGFYGADPTFTSLTVTTLAVTGTATIATLAATAGTVSGANITTASNTQTLTNKTLTSPAITTPTGLVKGDVGLGNVDNTSDATKNAATATLTNKTIAAGSNTISGLANANVDAAAGIARSKLANGSASHVVINDGSGGFSSEAQLAIARGGTGLGTLGTAGQALRVNAGATGLEYASVGGDVVGPASATSGRVAVYNGTTGKLLQDGTKLEADLVTGPASSVDSEFAIYNSTTGKLIKRASGTGYAYGTSGVASFLTTIPAADVAGRTSGDPAAGRIGEMLQSRVTSSTTYAVATDTYGDAASLSLTAGVWDITAVFDIQRGSAVFSSTLLIIGIGTGSGTSTAGLQTGDNMDILSSVIPTTFGEVTLKVPTFRVSHSSTTTYYLKSYVGSFTTASPTYRCRISAVRAG